jgi:hypothetical protein
MIGVVARDAERAAVSEFFELFKTPWEFWCRDGRYDVVIRADDACDHGLAPLVIVYGAHATKFDDEMKRPPEMERRNATLFWDGGRFPVYGRCATFSPNGDPRLIVADGRDSAAWMIRKSGTTFVRVGYELFREVRLLLTVGQPAECASVPTLEQHIGFLRETIVGAGLPLVEIPPVPEGHRFMAVLSHDMDHPSIRLHRFDHTTLGFLYRAVVGSLIDLFGRRRSAGTLWRNWRAAATLPLVHLGLAKDFWSQVDRYRDIEQGLGSTFFVIPFAGCSGRTADGQASPRRASAYGVADIADQLGPLRGPECEVGVHGIDAWCDSASGSDERECVARVTGHTVKGSRMHWLFFDEQTPARLERAGFSYDSTFGYNETVGFRAGTMQAFRPMTADRLLELPLAIMDTALFYPARGNLAPKAARETVWRLVEEAERSGGALVINWHDRSLAPERLWGEFYIALVDGLKRRGAWFPTGSQAVGWFEQRRSAVFNSVRRDGNSVLIKASARRVPGLPGLTIRIHAPRSSEDRPTCPQRFRAFRDVAFEEASDARIAFDAACA